MHILFLTHYFPPEVGAPQARIFETCRQLVELGHEVTVLTGFPHYPGGRIFDGYRWRLFMKEEMEGVRVVRSWVYATRNRGSLHRVANQFSFALSSLAGSLLVGGCNVMVVESPPLFLGVSGYVIGRLKRAPFMFYVADLWPESAVVLGVLRGRVAIKMAKLMESFIYRRATWVAGVTEGICCALLREGVPARKIVHLTNGVDTTFFQPVADRKKARDDLLSAQGFVAMYAGTIGLAQGLGVALDAAKLLADEGVSFLLIGDGAEKERLVIRAQVEGIENVRFLPTQERDRMPAIISAADVFLVTLKGEPLFEAALPSKIFEAMACARPLVLVARGEAADLVGRSGAGLVVEPDDPRLLADAILKIKGDSALGRSMGRSGRLLVERNFDRVALVRRLEEKLSRVGKENGDRS